MKTACIPILAILMFSGCIAQQSGNNNQGTLAYSDPIGPQKVVTPPQPDVSAAAVQEEAASARSEIVGSAAPDFNLPDKDGKSVTLTALRGQWVVLYFYPKDDTPGCTVEANEFTQLENQFHNLNATVIGVNGDSTDSHKNFSDKFNIGVNLLSDADYQVMKSYGAWVEASLGDKHYGRVIRSTVLIDPTGIIRYHWPEVIPDGHAGRVIQKLAEIQSNDSS